MTKGRLEAFSDGVMAIIITIMVLEIKVPHGSEFSSLIPLIPVALSYVLSFTFIGIYWNNHHHLLHSTRKVNGNILWANLHLLFWLSLIPFVTGWMGENHFAPSTLSLYGVILLMSAVAYTILQFAIIKTNGKDSLLSNAIGKDKKGKVSLLFYLIAIPAAFFSEWISGILYISVALIWLIPDKRIERVLPNIDE
jgi:uncharacterized membrane protein